MYLYCHDLWVVALSVVVEGNHLASFDLLLVFWLLCLLIRLRGQVFKGFPQANLLALL